MLGQIEKTSEDCETRKRLWSKERRRREREKEIKREGEQERR